MVTLGEAVEWCERRGVAFVESGGTLASAPHEFWELARMDVGGVSSQHLLFEVSPVREDGRVNLSFSRQIWFADDDEPEIFGFEWFLASDGASPVEEAAVFGARDGEVCGWEGAWLPWDAFRQEVDRRIANLSEAGYRIESAYRGYPAD